MNPFVLYSRLPRWVDLLVLAMALGLVWLASSIPPDEIPEMELFAHDKVLHFLMYLGVGVAIWVAGRRHGLLGLRHRLGSPWRAMLLGVVLPGALWAASDEFHQLFTGRTCSAADWLADLIGLLVAASLCRWLEKRWDRLHESAR